MTQNNVNVSVLGCGWIGLKLAKNLVDEGFSVKGSVRTTEKVDVLKSMGIDPFLVHFNSQDTNDSLQDFLRCDVLVITIPPQRDKHSHDQVKELLHALPYSIERIILISSSSVYGEPNQPVNEYSSPNPETISATLMLEMEQEILFSRPTACIVRSAGQIGPGRHPGRFFSGKPAIPNGMAPVNLIHQDDVCGIISALIKAKGVQGIYNACSLTHPVKQEFYTLAAKSAGLPSPEFISEKREWKIVESKRIPTEMNYNFKHPDLVHWLDYSGKDQ